jgi:hypothetical protein
MRSDRQITLTDGCHDVDMNADYKHPCTVTSGLLDLSVEAESVYLES